MKPLITPTDATESALEKAARKDERTRLLDEVEKVIAEAEKEPIYQAAIGIRLVKQKLKALRKEGEVKK